MKLKELLTEKFEGRELEFPSYQFLKKDLEPIKEELLKCEEFMFCDDIVFIDLPAQIIDDTTLTSQTFKIGDNTKFKGKVYLYNLSLSPIMYDPNKLLTPVKNGAAIGPTIYDPTDFTPRKHILLTWNPEMSQDIIGLQKELTFKNDIHKLLDDVLNNPEEYKVKGERGLLLRGVCETVESVESPSFLVGDTNELSNRHKNAIKNTFPDLEIQKEVEPQTQLEELNEYLRLLADMDNIGIRRKLFLLEGYMNKVIIQLK